MHSEKEMVVQSQNMVDVVKELLNVMTIDNSDESDEICANQKRETRSFVIELEQDDEFFKLLLKELNEASKLQDETTEKFKQDISALESRMSKVVRDEGMIGKQVLSAKIGVTRAKEDRHV